MYLNAAVNLMPLIKNDRVKALAITGDQRYPAVPNVPTFKEAGLPSFNAKGWFGLIAPGGLPKPILDKLSQEIKKALAAPEFVARMRDLGTDPFINTPEQFGELMKSDMVRYADVIKKANLKMN